MTIAVASLWWREATARNKSTFAGYYDHSGGDNDDNDNGNDKDHNKRPIKETFSQKLRKY